MFNYDIHDVFNFRLIDKDMNDIYTNIFSKVLK